MNVRVLLACLLATLTSSASLAWGNHSFVSYRVLEKLPEVANAAPLTVEPLETFLREEEETIEALLASQEAWASANLDSYPPRPSHLAFTANPKRSDEARRLAFLTALRVAPNSRFALYLQPDPHGSQSTLPTLPYAAVNTLPEPRRSLYRFVALSPGDQVDALSVIATACDEPDYGLDINLWDDSPSEWGKTYGFGALPFGNPTLPFATQAPFHMGFLHESKLLYIAAPFLKKTFPLLRAFQFSGLSELAFRTAHPYWGWRFAGISLHYVQDLTQPYHSSVAPGESMPKLLGANLMDLLGMHGVKRDMVVLLSNRHLALEKYQTELLYAAALAHRDTGIEKALHNQEHDGNYPEWTDRYLREVVSQQAHALAPKLARAVVASFPPSLVSDPEFDFGINDSDIDLTSELTKRDPVERQRLDELITELMANFGAHSRNALRAILRASYQF
jgi:hypothetical protein